MKVLCSVMIAVFTLQYAFAQQGRGPQTPEAIAAAKKAAEDKAKWMKEQNNWGRWGKDDELGAANLITDAKRKEAAALVKAGVTVSLSRKINLVDRTPAIKTEDRPATTPFYEMRVRTYGPNSGEAPAGYSFDMQATAYHGGTYTHFDGLCHISYEGKLYNGFLQEEVVDPVKGCQKMGVQLLKNGIVTRGILIDWPRLKGAALAPTDRLRPEDIEAWEKKAHVKIAPGDAVFLYTGWKEGMTGQGAIYDPSVVTLFHSRGVALVGADRVSGDHQLTITALGAYLIDNCDLNAAAETAARLNRWEFMLMVAPIPTPGATGSILNPLAMF